MNIANDLYMIVTRASLPRIINCKIITRLKVNMLYLSIHKLQHSDCLNMENIENRQSKLY